MKLKYLSQIVNLAALGNMIKNRIVNLSLQSLDLELELEKKPDFVGIEYFSR